MPNPVDQSVGLRLREARIYANMTQQQLAESLGISFQQVQKYENGLNRIGASRLTEMAQTLNVRIKYLFQDVDADGAVPHALDKEGATIARDWRRIADPNIRAVMKDIIRSYA